MSPKRLLKLLLVSLVVASASYYYVEGKTKKVRVTAVTKTKSAAATKAAEPKAAAPAAEAKPALPPAAASSATSQTTAMLSAASGANASVGGDAVAPYYGKKFDHGSSAVKMVALTFDDGPYAKTTPRVLEILKSEGVTATFFMLGQSVQKYPEMAKIVASGDYEIGCHTTEHQSLVRKDAAYIDQEVNGTAGFIEQVTGKRPHVFRPPFGAYNRFVLESCAAGKMVMVNWSVDTNDWRKGSTPASIQAAVAKYGHSGAVILMHDTHEKSIQALPSVIKDLKAKGYQFVTVSQLIAESLKHAAAPSAAASADGGEVAPVASHPASIPLSKSGF